MKAKQIIKKLVSKYERCSTYRDHGYFIDGSSKTWFKSYFTRPNRVVFTTSTSQENLHDEQLGDRIIWWNEGRIFGYWSSEVAGSGESRVQKLTDPFNQISTRLPWCALALLAVPELSSVRSFFENEFRLFDENVETIQLVADLKPIVSLEVTISFFHFHQSPEHSRPHKIRPNALLQILNIFSVDGA